MSRLLSKQSLSCLILFTAFRAAPAAPLFFQEMVSISFEDGFKAAVKHPDPVYSPVARQMKIRGKVEITAFVDLEGRVTSTIVVVGNSILTQMAQEAVKKWEFTPFRDDAGKPATAMIHILFDLKPPPK
jgi:TonB family protein